MSDTEASEFVYSPPGKRVTVTQLSPKTNVSSGDEIMITDSGSHINKRTSLESIKKMILEEVAVSVIKCSSCGQWGARRCECLHCGAPIE